MAAPVDGQWWWTVAEVRELSGLSARQLQWARDAGALGSDWRRRGLGAHLYGARAVDAAMWFGCLRRAGISSQHAREVLPCLLRGSDRPWIPGELPFVLLVRRRRRRPGISPLVVAAGRLVTIAGSPIPSSLEVLPLAAAVPEVARG